MITRLGPEQGVKAGRSFPLGIDVTRKGVNFAVYSPDAHGIEVCFFDELDNEISRARLPAVPAIPGMALSPMLRRASATVFACMAPSVRCKGCGSIPIR